MPPRNAFLRSCKFGSAAAEGAGAALDGSPSRDPGRGGTSGEGGTARSSAPPADAKRMPAPRLAVEIPRCSLRGVLGPHSQRALAPSRVVRGQGRRVIRRGVADGGRHGRRGGRSARLRRALGLARRTLERQRDGEQDGPEQACDEERDRTRAQRARVGAREPHARVVGGKLGRVRVDRGLAHLLGGRDRRHRFPV